MGCCVFSGRQRVHGRAAPRELAREHPQLALRATAADSAGVAPPAGGRRGGAPPAEGACGGGQEARGDGARSAGSAHAAARVAMGRYSMSMAHEDLLGEGTSSICWRATDLATGQHVAVKVYKRRADETGKRDVRLQKFKRQISVLQELQEPFTTRPSDPSLWNEQLDAVKAHRLFMRLLDFSKDASGKPGPDAGDGVMYVVTELGQYSLKDYLQLRREQGQDLPKEAVRHIAKAIVLVMAGLHAKGFVHIDLKPENLMMFNGRLKLIDVDGCIRTGSKLSIQDSSISFSPCYCAPEWARFLIEDGAACLTVLPSLDVWSVGMTLGELVTLDAVLKPTYTRFLKNGLSHREAGFLFMDWLGSIDEAPLPKGLREFDDGFLDLLLNWLLVADHTKRRTLAQCLASPFLVASGQQTVPEPPEGSPGRTAGRPLPGRQDATLAGAAAAAAGAELHALEVPRRARRQEVGDHAALHKGILWKLNQGGDPAKREHWLKRDMWLARNGSLCYYSLKEDKRLILIDGGQLCCGEVSLFSGGVIQPAIEIRMSADRDDREQPAFILGCESREDYVAWTRAFEAARLLTMQTFQLGPSLAVQLKEFRLAVKNRRLRVDARARDAYTPVFKSKLWKLKADTDPSRSENWFEREMWISQNGSLVYFSVKEERELIYYTPSDLASASVQELDGSGSCKRWGFHVVLPARNGVEFTPSEFAAESRDLRSLWIERLRRL